jgi:SAM-dependent methyltransferase
MTSRRLSDALRAAEGRAVSSGSVFSTILLSTAIGDAAPSGARTVLDVGCGESPYRTLVPCGRYVGIDHGRPRTGGVAGRVVGDVAALPFASGVFDVVLCTEVIEHVRDERALAEELARVAEPGAKLLLSSPFVHGPHELPRDFRRLTPLGIVETLERSGWAVEEMAALGGPLVVSIDSAVRWFDSWVGRIARHLPFAGAARAAATRVSATLQQLLAAAVLTHPRLRPGRIDPGAMVPRLTLGYVVVATRRGG